MSDLNQDDLLIFKIRKIRESKLNQTGNKSNLNVIKVSSQPQNNQPNTNKVNTQFSSNKNIVTNPQTQGTTNTSQSQTQSQTQNQTPSQQQKNTQNIPSNIKPDLTSQKPNTEIIKQNIKPEQNNVQKSLQNPNNQSVNLNQNNGQQNNNGRIVNPNVQSNQNMQRSQSYNNQQPRIPTSPNNTNSNLNYLDTTNRAPPKYQNSSYRNNTMNQPLNSPNYIEAPQMGSDGMYVVPQKSGQQLSQNMGGYGGIDSYYVKSKSAKETKSEQESKRLAINLMCTWHPWRPAYAVCKYCHRPFCYEDLVNYKGNYYCLEDIDKVSNGEGDSNQNAGESSINLSMITSVLMILPLIILVFLDSSQISTAIAFLIKLGLIPILSTKYFSYAIILAESLIVVLEFIGGIMLFIKSRFNFIYTLVIQIIAIAIFTYESILYVQFPIIMVAVFTFMAFVLNLYSNFVSTPVGSEESSPTSPNKKIDPVQSNFSNVGKF